MNKEQLWEIFAASGKIDDYPIYLNKKDSVNDNT